MSTYSAVGGEGGPSTNKNVEAGDGVDVDSVEVTEENQDTKLSSDAHYLDDLVIEPIVIQPSHPLYGSCSVCEPYYCQICFGENEPEDGYKLPCQHVFCKECIVSYLGSKITDGKVYPTCFYMDKKEGESGLKDDTNKSEEGGKGRSVAVELPSSPSSSPTTEGQLTLDKYKTCGEVIPPETIEELLINNEEIFLKYRRFKYSKENANARECPHCAVWNTCTDPAQDPKITCGNADCAKCYCFAHANAHDFALFPTCAEYEASIAPQLQASVALINSSSKPCPGCHIYVQKTGEQDTRERAMSIVFCSE